MKGHGHRNTPWDELSHVVRDEDTTDIQLETMLGLLVVLVVKLIRGVLGDVQDRAELDIALCSEVDVGEGFGVVLWRMQTVEVYLQLGLSL